MAVLGTAERELRAQDSALADLFQGILVSVDPDRDSLEQLGSYATPFLRVFSASQDLAKLWFP